MIDLIVSVVDQRLIWAALAALLSSSVQGYSGFGGGLILVPVLAILFGPVDAAAIGAVLGLAANAVQIPRAFPQADRAEIVPLGIAVLLIVPFGLLVLIHSDPVLIRKAMGAFILVTTLFLASGFRYSGRRGVLSSGIAGLFAGGVTACFGIPGGPFVVAYFISSDRTVPVQRANILSALGIIILTMIAGLALNGIYRPETIMRSAVLLPLSMTGSMIGYQLFKIAPAAWFKYVAYSILALTGTAALIV